MKRTIRTEHVREHELSDQQIKCFKTGVGMSDGYIAKPGDWITYEEKTTDDCSRSRAGRMLGRVKASAVIGQYPSPAIDGYLSVLALSDDCTYAYIRWVAPEDVRGIRKTPPAAFLAFMTGELPDATIVHQLSAYGTLSDRYIANMPHHVQAFEAGVSPAAWDAGVRSANGTK